MPRLNNKRILLGITGSIAAYKSAFLARQLMREGAEVRVVMTSSARDFVSPLTFSTLTGHPVLDRLSTEEGWSDHVKWGRWADLMIVAPITARTLAKMSQGLVDNMLTACYLSSTAPVLVAPAMDVDMWQHPSTQRNIDQLKEDGIRILSPDSGPLASGLEGTGRMMEPDAIIEIVCDQLNVLQDNPLKGKSILITAGPTREAIDPIRFLSNASSGKTGIALAEEADRRGAEVTLILGPTHEQTKSDSIRVYRVTSAEEMYRRTEEHFPEQDIAIFCAAVSDFRPAEQAEQKIKKTDETPLLKLERNPDIAAQLGRKKKSNQFLVGFALETEHGEEYAMKKMKDKHLDMIVLNRAGQEDIGMGADQNEVRFLFPDNKSESFELKSKKEIAEDILNTIGKHVNDKA